MQISTKKENLASPLSLVAGAADLRGTVPMLGMVLLKATEAGQLSMLCSDSGLLARTLTPVNVKRGGEIAVDVARLRDLVRAFPDKQDIELNVEDSGTLLVKAGRSRFRLPTRAAADYPRMIPGPADRVAVTMSAKRLAEMLADVSPSMADNDTRVFLNGALLALEQGGLWAVSTDGYRMTVSHESIAGLDSVTPRQIILPRKTVLLARKLLAQGSNVTLTLSEKDAQFTFGDNSVLLANAIDAKYPGWRGVLPATTEQVVVSSTRMMDALAMLAAANDAAPDKPTAKVHVVDLTFTQSMTTLRRGESGLCEVESTSTTDAPFSLAFNLGYLTDAVNLHGDCDELRIGYAPNVGSIAVRPKDKEYPMSVVMRYRA